VRTGGVGAEVEVERVDSGTFCVMAYQGMHTNTGIIALEKIMKAIAKEFIKNYITL